MAYKDLMRRSDLNVLALSAAERWELYCLAEQYGFLTGLPDVPPGPLGKNKPLTQLSESGLGRMITLRNALYDPSGISEDKRMAACYAFHVWRERCDIWEPTPQFQTGRGRYDRHWMMNIDEDGGGDVLYDTFISAFELERYFVNPWIRAIPWIRFQNLSTLEGYTPATPMSAVGIVKKEKPTIAVPHYTAQPVRWAAKQKGSRVTGYFGPIEAVGELGQWVLTGHTPTAGIDEASAMNGERWNNGEGDDKLSRAVRLAQRHGFQWEEYMWRADEWVWLIGAIDTMFNESGDVGRGGSWGVGVSEMLGRQGGSERAARKEMWRVEKKLLNMLRVRVANFGQNFLDPMKPLIIRNVKFSES